MLFLLLVAYVLACIAVALYQRHLLYFPQKFTPDQVDADARSSGLERWMNPAGEPIGMKHLATTQPADGQVLLTYGNGSYATGSARYADAIQSVANFDVYILEYPGYADRPGKPSQKTIFQAADEGFQLLDTNKPTFLVGESLGTGVSAYLAGTHPDRVAGLLLFAPYNRLADVAQYHFKIIPVRLFLTERFPSEDYLQNYHGPLGILVGGKDNVVPEKFGRRLYDHYAGPKHLWPFPAADHGSVTDQPSDFWKQATDFLQDNRHPL